MELKDVKIDGTTLYICKHKNRQCVIEASLVSDGAALVACDISDDHFLELWTTEACYLQPVVVKTKPVGECIYPGVYGRRLKYVEALAKYKAEWIKSLPERAE